MRVGQRLVVASFAGLSTVVAGCTMAPKPLMVKCTMEGDQIDVVSLDLARGQARLLSVAPALTGTSHTTETEYEALFQPGPEGAPRLHIKINRYSFRATREPGRRDAAAGAASHSTGTCERYRGRPL